MKNIIKYLREKLRKILICNHKIKKLKNQDFTIIANDCIGGVLYHEFGLQFTSPLINMYMNAPDYIKFIYNPQKYLNTKMKELPEETKNCGYPVVTLDDIKLYLVHYKDVHEAQIKWDERKLRINWENIFYIMNDRNFCTEDEIEKFEAFSGKNKVIFVHKKIKEESLIQYYIKGSESKDYVDTMTEYTSLLTRRFDQFDFVEWFNKA